MKAISARFVLFNAAAILVALAAVIAVIRSFLVSPSLAPCSERYATSMTFPLARDGVMLTATDIHARTGGRDAGLLQNLEIVPLKSGPAPAAMSISLPKGSAPASGSAIPHGGISFPWQPRSISSQPAVCLSYQIFFPADFDFHVGGMLPGVEGHADESEDRFLVQAAWRQGGAIGATNTVTIAGKKLKQMTDDGPEIPRGRWVKVEQEVVLNAPANQENGILRVWIDGALAIDKNDFVYRNKGDVRLSGVAADLFYGGEDTVARSPADAKVLVSPFELSWQ
jgi:hypothetical protein